MGCAPVAHVTGACIGVMMDGTKETTMGYWKTTIENDGTLYWRDYEWIPDEKDEKELSVRDPQLAAMYRWHDRLDDYDLDGLEDFFAGLYSDDSLDATDDVVGGAE